MRDTNTSLRICHNKLIQLNIEFLCTVVIMDICYHKDHYLISQLGDIVFIRYYKNGGDTTTTTTTTLFDLDKLLVILYDLPTGIIS